MQFVQYRFQPFFKTFISLFLAVVLVFSSVSPTLAAESDVQTPQLTSENIEAFLDAFFATPGVEPHYVGASIVVVHEDQIIAQKGIGYADVAKETLVDPASTKFRIASVSKTFTAVAVLQLVEQGKIDLHADIQTYLDGIEVINPFDIPVMVEHLLTHQTGFEVRDPAAEDLHMDYDKFVEMEDYVRANMPPVVRQPGNSYMYDNFAFLLLGLIVQNVSGVPYENYMEEHIFTPLNMKNSTFLFNEAVLSTMATGYDPANQPIDPYTFTPTIMPHGGMMSTAEDVGKFMVALLNSGQTASGRILNEESVEAMTVYRSAIHPLMPNTTYGFESASQVPGAGSNPAIITKAGDLPGNSSYLLLIPEQDVGVFLTYNKQGILRELFYQQFLMTFFPEYTLPSELEPYPATSVEELQKLSGLYSDLRVRILVSSITVADDGSLIISDALIGPRPLQQVDEYLFTDQLTGQYTAFVFDEQSGSFYMKEPYLNPLGYSRQGWKPVGFSDVAADHPYATFIFGLQSLGHVPNEVNEAFYPEQEVTRGEMVQQLLEISMIRGSKSTELAFTDIEGHPHAAYIQAAYELGMVKGDGTGQFAPDREATRQEVAVMIWNLLHLQYPDVLFDHVKVEADVADWALPAVKMLAVLGLHGPEVRLKADGSIHFQATKFLNRQEAAALFYQLLNQPTDQIVAGLQAQLEAESANPEEGDIEHSDKPAAGDIEESVDPAIGDTVDSANPAEVDTTESANQ